MDASEVDWETINEQLVYDHSEESHARRREIWNGMNVNGNQYLSLAEVDKGIIDVIKNINVSTNFLNISFIAGFRVGRGF